MSDITLRDYFERLLKDFGERLAERDRLKDEALELQAQEYSRRLDGLNHAHAEAVRNWNTSLPREMFEQWVKGHQQWKDGVDRELTAAQSRASTYTAMLGVVFVVVQIALRFWK